MKYNKPTVDVLGDATGVIQGPKIAPQLDAPGVSTDPANPPAYDLDE